MDSTQARTVGKSASSVPVVRIMSKYRRNVRMMEVDSPAETTLFFCALVLNKFNIQIIWRVPSSLAHSVSILLDLEVG